MYQLLITNLAAITANWKANSQPRSRHTYYLQSKNDRQDTNKRPKFIANFTVS